jgi:hypothetical protein
MHYGVGVVPARPYKPRDKAAFGVAASHICLPADDPGFQPSIVPASRPRGMPLIDSHSLPAVVPCKVLCGGGGNRATRVTNAAWRALATVNPMFTHERDPGRNLIS